MSGGGSQTVEQDTSPWPQAQPYILSALEQGRQLFPHTLRNPPVAEYSPLSAEADALTKQRLYGQGASNQFAADRALNILLGGGIAPGRASMLNPYSDMARLEARQAGKDPAGLAAEWYRAGIMPTAEELGIERLRQPTEAEIADITPPTPRDILRDQGGFTEEILAALENPDFSKFIAENATRFSRRDKEETEREKYIRERSRRNRGLS